MSAPPGERSRIIAPFAGCPGNEPEPILTHVHAAAEPSTHRDDGSRPGGRFIEGTRPLKIVDSYLSRFFKLLRQPLQRRKRLRRYVELSPRVCRRQVLLDRKLGRRIELEVRDGVDQGTLGQVFLNEDYGLEKLTRHAELTAFRDRVLAAGKTPLIIDCGGNIGLAARYFAENHPGSRVVCIEPDAGNARQARRNNPSASVTVQQAAIGSQASRGRIVDPGMGNNAFRIEAGDSADDGIEILSINDLLRQHDPAIFVPFIVKIDIEGFEAELFSRNIEWIARFPLMIVELHDWLLPRSASTRTFLAAIASEDRDFVYHGENSFSISNTLL